MRPTLWVMHGFCPCQGKHCTCTKTFSSKMLMNCSGLWFKAPWPDQFQNAKSDGSCLLLSDARTVMMYGGCFLKNGEPCLDYFYKEIAYDMSHLELGNFKYRAVGYLVPDNIASVIGGT